MAARQVQTCQFPGYRDEEETIIEHLGSHSPASNYRRVPALVSIHRSQTCHRVGQSTEICRLRRVMNARRPGEIGLLRIHAHLSLDSWHRRPGISPAASPLRQRLM